MAEITSLLWKSSLLSGGSSYFPRMVQAAAWFHNREYTDEMLRKVASKPDILSALHLNEDETIDQVLLRLASNPETSEALDRLILGAVESYITPTPSPANQGNQGNV